MKKFTYFENDQGGEVKEPQEVYNLTLVDERGNEFGIRYENGGFYIHNRGMRAEFDLVLRPKGANAVHISTESTK